MEFKQVPIEGLEYYQVSKCGMVKNTNPHHSARQPKVYINEGGYLYIMATNQITNRQTRLSVHRAVALSWVDNPNPEVYDIVMHLDDNRQNPHADNLQWGTQKMNMQQSSQTGHYSTVKKEVDLISPEGKKVHVVGLRAFCSENNIDWGNFQKLIKKKGSTKAVKGWRLAD